MVRVLSASARSSQRNRRLRVITVTGEDHTGRCRLVWFNQEYLVRALSPGTIVVARGIASVDGTYGPSMRVGSDLALRSSWQRA